MLSPNNDFSKVDIPVDAYSLRMVVSAGFHTRFTAKQINSKAYPNYIAFLKDAANKLKPLGNQDLKKKVEELSL